MPILAFFILFFISACGPRGPENICTDSFDQPRECSQKESSMIAGIQSIINQVRHFDAKSINENFDQAGAALSDARALFFGEEHTDIVSQIETLGAINALARDGDMLLLEGADRSVPIQINCGYYLILILYVNWQWEKLGQPYNVANVQAKTDWQKAQKLSKLFWDTRFSYDISDLNISKLHCAFWDSENAIKETVSKNAVTQDTLKKRNESMVIGIRESLSKGNRRVIIVSGYRHMPNIDLAITESLNKNKKAQFPKDLGTYYELVRHAKTRPAASVIKLDSGSGTTEPIFKYLTENHIPFREFLHRRLER